MASQGTHAHRASKLLVSWLVLLAIASFVSPPVWATRYVYDANGRLVAVTDDSGESARYVYDVMGNILRVERIQASDLQIFAMTPTHGTVDTPVSIRGQGFSSSVSDNAVTFNGVPAVISTATANELKVSVPYGAATGPVTVTVGSRSTTSSAPFTVDDTGLPPVIGTVSPDVAVVGSSLAVEGSHLYPIPGKTSLRIGGRSLDVGQGSSNIRLSAVLPPSASSGRMTVQTPYGSAESVQTVLVVPAGIDPAAVRSRSVTTLDTSAGHVDLADGSSYAAVMFDSQDQPWISLQLANFSGSSGNIGYTVYAPGNVATQQGTVSASSASIHLNRIQGAGTYLVLFRTADGGSTSFDASATSNAVFSDTSLDLVTQAPSQSVRAVFHADAKDTLVVKIEAPTTEPSNASVNYSVYNPSGTFYTSGVTSGAGSINLPDLPEAGTWQVVASPGAGTRGSMHISVLEGAVGVLQPGGDPVHLDAVSTSQNAYIDFHANAFDNLELTLSGVSIDDTSTAYYGIQVYGPAGEQVASSSCYVTYPGGNCNLHLWYLAEGNYHAVVTPYYGGRLHLDATLQPHVVGPASAADQTVSVDLQLGQAERLTFDAAAGQTVALYLSGTHTQPEGQNVRVLVYRPDAGAITTQTRAYTDFTTNGSRVVNLPDLPVGGRYTVLLLPDYGVAASTQVSIVPGAAKTLEINADPVNVDASISGQNTYIDFTLASHESVEFALSEVTLPGAGYGSYQVDIRTANGQSVDSRQCYTQDQGCQFHLWDMAPGRYRATISAEYYGGVFHAKARLSDVIKGRSLTRGAPVSVGLAAGTAEFLTFHANVGDTVALAANSQTTTPAGQNVRYIVYRPDSGALAASTPSYTEMKTPGPQLVNLPDLPISGDYTVVVTSDSGASIQAQVELIEGAAGALPNDGSPVSFEAHGNAQSAYVDFVAYAGESAELSFFDVSLVGAGYDRYTVEIRNSAGQYIDSRDCYMSQAGGDCSLHLWGMPAGKYRATLNTSYYGGTLSLKAALRDHKLFSAVGTGTPVSMSLGRGDVGRTSFHAEAGDTLALLESGIQTDPAGRNVRFLVYRPDAGTITTATPAYADFTRGGDQLIDLPNLPVSGDYTVLAVPDYGTPASLQIALLGGVTGNLPSDGTSQTFETHGSQQSAYFEFEATDHANLEVALSHLSSTSEYKWFYLNIQNAAGINVGYATCYTSDPGCAIHLWYAARGRYRATVTMQYPGTMRFEAVVREHTTGKTLSVAAPLSLDLGTGQAERLTFHANAGDSFALEQTGFVTDPVNQQVRFIVYSPDAGAITTATPSFADVTRGGNSVTDLPNLPVTGDYTLLVLPSYGVAAHVRLNLLAGATATLRPDDEATSIQAPGTGQTAYLTFHAEQRDDLELDLRNIVLTNSANTWVDIELRNAAGQSLTYATCYVSYPGCHLHLWYAAAGDYSLIVRNSGGGSLSFDASLRRDKVGTTLPDGNKQSVILGRGDVERLSFQATAGDSRTLLVSDVQTAPGGQPVVVSVFGPDAGAITTDARTITSQSVYGMQLIELNKLPSTGTYTVVLSPQYGVAATLDITQNFVRSGSQPVPQPTNIEVDAPARHFTSPSPGQPIKLVFDTVRGMNLELAGNHVSQDAGQSSYTVNVYDPDGNQVIGTWCDTSWIACGGDLWNLLPGQYTAIYTPQGGATSLALDAEVRRNPQGGSLVRGTQIDINAPNASTVRYTFDATLGETVALQLSDFVASEPNVNVNVRVYRPDGGSVLPNNAFSSGNTRDRLTLNLDKLPATGTYTVLVDADSLVAFGAKLLLAAGATGNQLQDGVVSHVAANAMGEHVWLDFDTTGGDFDLALGHVVTEDNNNYVPVHIYNPLGTEIDNFVCYPSDPQCAREMWNLAPGKYRILAQAYANQTKLSFDAVVVRQRIGGKLIPGISNNLSSASGEMIRYTFDASEGDTVALRLDGLTTAPYNSATNLRVYRPNGGQILPTSYYSNIGVRGNGTLNLSNLPESGTYTVVMHVDYLVPGQGTLTLVNGIGRTIANTQSAPHLAAQVGGQNLSFLVDLSTSGNYNLTLAHPVDANGGNDYFSVNIFTDEGVSVDSYSCYPSYPNCNRDMWNAKAGRYRVIVQSSSSTARLGFDALVKAHIEGGKLIRGKPVDASRGVGDMDRFTFDGQAGDAVSLKVSGAQTTPSGQGTGIRVYRPDGGLIINTQPYASANGYGEVVLNLSPLPVTGTYTIVLAADYLVASQGTITLADADYGSVTEGVSKHVDASIPGQSLYFNLDVPEPGNYQFDMAHVTTNGDGDSYYAVTIYNPSGTVLFDYTCYASYPGCSHDLWDIPAGSYRVVMRPSTNGARFSLDATLRRNADKGMLQRNVPSNIDSVDGDLYRYTFAASEGEALTLQLTGVVTHPSNLAMNIRVYRPNGGRILPERPYASMGTRDTGLLNLKSLPETGVYTVVLHTDYLSPAKGSLTLLDSIHDMPLTPGVVAQAKARAPGQPVSFDMDVPTDGNYETLLLQTPGVVTSILVDVTVTNSDDVVVSSYSCYTADTCGRDLWNVKAGKYRMTVSPSYGNETLDINARIVKAIDRGVLSPSQTVEVSRAVGEELRFTFEGQRKDSVTLTLAGVTSDPASLNTYIRVYRPDVGVIDPDNRYAILGTTTDGDLNLTNLPVTGTYTVVVNSDRLAPATGHLTLNSGTAP